MEQFFPIQLPCAEDLIHLSYSSPFLYVWACDSVFKGKQSRSSLIAAFRWEGPTRSCSENFHVPVWLKGNNLSYCFPWTKFTWRVFHGLLFHPWEGILLFFLLYFTILFPNPIFLQLSKVHLSGALEGSSRNSEQKFLHLNRMIFILVTMIKIKLGIKWHSLLTMG